MTASQLIDVVSYLTRAISGDETAVVRALPVAGREQTLILMTPKGMGRLLGKGGETFNALRRVVSAAGWRTGFAFRLVLAEPQETQSVSDQYATSDSFDGSPR